MTTWSVTCSPTFLNELINIPKQISKRVNQKIAILEKDPYSAQGDAIKLKNSQKVYRTRIGNYRLVYTISDSLIKILSIRKRDEHTYTDVNASFTSPNLITPESYIEPILQKQYYSVNKTFIFEEKKLPKVFTESLLNQWKIPANYWQEILLIKTEEELLNLEIPEQYLNRILDNLFPRSLEEIEGQPAYVLNKVEDLDKFLDGDLTNFLLKLDPDQEKIKNFGKEGPVLVKGGPGSGKSTLALYRVQKLLQEGYKSILFTTYTKALANYSQQLLEQLLQTSPESVGVQVNTVDSLIFEYYKKQYGEPVFAKSHKANALLRKALNKAIHNGILPGKNASECRAKQQSLERLGIDYLLEEIETVILDGGLVILDDYLAVSRRGRGTPLNQNLREAIWLLYEIWSQLLEKEGFITWQQVRCKALAIAQSLPTEKKPFQAFIIDEAQDLSPVALRFLIALVPNLNGVYLTADASQSLYQKSFSWQQIHQDFKVTGRTLLLKRNYRNTQQIALACQQILDNTQAGDIDCIKQFLSPYQGEQPCLYQAPNPMLEVEQIKQFLVESAKQHRLPLWSSAVLCPTNEIAQSYASRLQQLELKAQFVRGNQINLKARYIKVLTLHAAKGLEFPFVVLALAQSQFPQMLPYKLPPEEQQLYLDNQRRLFYVGCSRAMRKLLVTLSSSNILFFENLIPPYWQKV